jgi:hypothetical protein
MKKFRPAFGVLWTATRFDRAIGRTEWGRDGDSRGGWRAESRSGKSSASDCRAAWIEATAAGNRWRCGSVGAELAHRATAWSVGHSEASRDSSPRNAREFCMSSRKRAARGNVSRVLPETCEMGRARMKNVTSFPKLRDPHLRGRFALRSRRVVVTCRYETDVPSRKGVDCLQNSPARTGISRFYSETPLQNVHNSAGLHAGGAVQGWLCLAGTMQSPAALQRRNTGFQPVRPAGFQPAESTPSDSPHGESIRRAGSPRAAQAGSLCYGVGASRQLHPSGLAPHLCSHQAPTERWAPGASAWSGISRLL